MAEAAWSSAKRLAMLDSMTGPPSEKLFVGSLPEGCDIASLNTVFGAYGVIQSIKLLPSQPGTKTAATVRFATVDQAKWVVENVNGTIPQGLTEAIECKYAMSTRQKAEAKYQFENPNAEQFKAQKTVDKARAFLEVTLAHAPMAKEKSSTAADEPEPEEDNGPDGPHSVSLLVPVDQVTNKEELVYDWKVVDDATVREGAVLNSTAFPTKLRKGAVIKGVDQMGNYVHYKLVKGEGPPTGWVSVKVGSHVLLEPSEEQANLLKKRAKHGPSDEDYAREEARG